MSKYLDNNGVLYLWGKIKAKFLGKDEVSSYTVTRIKGEAENSYSQGDVVMTPATIRALGANEKATSASKADTLTTKRAIDGVDFNGSAAIIHFGTCSTVAATAEKAVTCTGFTLVSGAWIAVKFSVTNSAAVANLKLNVSNGTTNLGAKPIKYRGGNLPSPATLSANRVYLFVYDGTNFELIGDLDTNTTYSAASQSAPGLMSAADKEKLDGIAVAANLFLVEEHVAGTNQLGTVKTTSTVTSASGYTPVPIIGGVPYFKNTTYNAFTPATASAAGAAGLVPAPAKNVLTKILTSGGGWQSIGFEIGTDSDNHTVLYAYAGDTVIDGLILPDWALKTDIAGMYKYKGSVATSDKLPATGNTAGDVYDVQSDGHNYAWNGSAWDDLGGTFRIEAITNGEIDTIVAS